MIKLDILNGKVYSKSGIIKQDVTSQFNNLLNDNMSIKTDVFDITNEVLAVKAGIVYLKLPKTRSTEGYFIYKFNSQVMKINDPSSSTKFVDILLPDLYFFGKFSGDKNVNKNFYLQALYIAISHEKNQFGTLRTWPFTNKYSSSRANTINDMLKADTCANKTLGNIMVHELCVSQSIESSFKLDNINFMLYSFLSSKNNYDLTPDLLPLKNIENKLKELGYGDLTFTMRTRNKTTYKYKDLNNAISNSFSDYSRRNLYTLNALSQLNRLDLIQMAIC